MSYHSPSTVSWSRSWDQHATVSTTFRKQRRYYSCFVVTTFSNTFCSSGSSVPALENTCADFQGTPIRSFSVESCDATVADGQFKRTPIAQFNPTNNSSTTAPPSSTPSPTPPLSSSTLTSTSTSTSSFPATPTSSSSASDRISLGIGLGVGLSATLAALVTLFLTVRPLRKAGSSLRATLSRSSRRQGSETAPLPRFAHSVSYSELAA